MKLVSDVCVQMPKYDALSASVLEAIYAVSITICGSWLPYGNFRRNGIQFYEAEDFQGLTDRLTKVLRDMDSNVNSMKDNYTRIEEGFLRDTDVHKWIKIYNELIEQ